MDLTLPIVVVSRSFEPPLHFKCFLFKIVADLIYCLKFHNPIKMLGIICGFLILACLLLMISSSTMVGIDVTF